MSGEGSTLIEKNIVIVGDGDTGKTCLIETFTDGEYTDKPYRPTVANQTQFNLKIQSKDFRIRIHDTAGQEEYERLRTLQYKNCDAFIVSYSVANRTSFDNIELKWWKDIKKEQPNIPIILVGNKCDLRDNENEEDNTVSVREGSAMKKKIGAAAFMESSSVKNYNVQRLFEWSTLKAYELPLPEVHLPGNVIGSVLSVQHNENKLLRCCCCSVM